MLEVLGIDAVSELVYRSILANPNWGVVELSGNLCLDEREVRLALDRLFEMTLLRQSLDRPGHFRPVSPEVGLRALVARHEAEIAARQREIAKSEAAIAEIVALHVARSSGASEVARDGMERIVSMDAIHARLEELTESVREEIACFTPGPARNEETLEAGRRNDARLLERGIKIRDLVQDSCRNHPATFAHFKWLTDAGAEVRTIPAVPSRLILIDGQTAMVPINPENSRDGILLLSGTGAIAGLMALFEQTWSVATPLTRLRQRDSQGLTSQGKELLRLLAAGLTDEAAAKRLGVSERTARRLMAELMERLGARSRFEAGLKAKQAGWL
ncbi:helix-turn-helix transcriptional regulator [Rhizomonospora bruguierae]|uniref:helix-turn-helix transcriptional regulator n=1 Tax=Rhizomonospora bruguierae TaxID=1581705 RepID=UPI001BCC9D82|nr:LuxR C-terminal-related transcriptional regulator [Micromonospora sp. NBRC 107566]